MLFSEKSVIFATANNTIMKNGSLLNSQEMWRCVRYSSIFSRSNFDRLLKKDDYSIFQNTIRDYDAEKVGVKLHTYSDFANYAYRYMVKHYRNEYVYKNSLINELLKEFGTKKTIIFNEFTVGNSIADMVLFIGKSRAYEIKTELDSNRRLSSQLADYKKIFQESFIVVHESCIEKYEYSDSTTGIIALSVNRGKVKFDPIRPATENNHIDPHVLIRCLRTYEYKELVKRYYGALPELDAFSAFTVCEKMIEAIPSPSLNQLFIEIIKERKTNMQHLRGYDSYLRQICLSMHINSKEFEMITKKLLKPIQI